jgi:M6 family metalloprotease-like protein
MSGSKRGLVILVNFSDQKMYYNRQLYDRFFNQVGFHDYGMEGSVHDYFLSQSYGQFDLSFDVVGPVTLSRQWSYYGENNSEGYDKHSGEMVAEACQMADEAVDFSKYDWDGDGYVDQVFIVYASYGENGGASAYTIWPHEYQLTLCLDEDNDGPGAIQLDGVWIDTYACSNELSGLSGTQLDGIGTACHEFTHCLYIPDMYDTEGSNFGMGTWDLMDYGTYNGNSCCPASYTSYERMYCGWLTPVVLYSSRQINNMQPITSAPEAYIIYNSAYAKEYYLLENHQQESWDKSAYGHGMLILHVDFDRDAWIDNTVNIVGSHQRMTFFPADGIRSLTLKSLAGDPWPGNSMNNEFSSATNPAATLYHKNELGVLLMEYALTDIKESNGLISFDFIGSGNALELVNESPSAPADIYDLSGRRVHLGGMWGRGSLSDHLSRGIYIINGQKVVVP